MRIKEIMTSEVEVIPESTSLVEAAQLMKKLNVGSLPVVEAGKVIGILTDRDIVIRSTAMGHDPNEVTAKDIMTPQPDYCYFDQDVKEVANLMGEKKIRRLPVLDREMQLVGIISLGDLATEADKNNLSGETLEKISKPSKPTR
jgi:CBS domain-containing protein